VAAQLAAFALLLRAALLPVSCASGIIGLAASLEDDRPFALALLDPSGAEVLCSHGAASQEDGSSRQSGKHGEHSPSACCGICCMPAVPAGYAVLAIAQAKERAAAIHLPDAVRLSVRAPIRNRDPPAFLSA
jgi:hypothetical protein